MSPVSHSRQGRLFIHAIREYRTIDQHQFHQHKTVLDVGFFEWEKKIFFKSIQKMSPYRLADHQGARGGRVFAFAETFSIGCQRATSRLDRLWLYEESF
jgi:hypothetical protein